MAVAPGHNMSPLHLAIAEMATAAKAMLREEGGDRASVEEYLVDNGQLQSPAPGLAYRMSKILEDKDSSQLAEWGSTVFGISEDGWLRVGARYLPFEVSGSVVLISPAESRMLGQVQAATPYSFASSFHVPKPLGGTSVEVRDLSVAATVDEHGNVGEEIHVDGMIGFCIGWQSDLSCYVVRDFEGSGLVAIPEANLMPWTPPPPEHGGFDVPWMGGVFDSELFSGAVTECLLHKGYCVLETGLSEALREAALEAGDDDERGFRRLSQELESGYLGLDNHTKIAPLHPSAAAASGLLGGSLPDSSAIADLEEDVSGPLGQCSQQITDLSLLLSTWASTRLGFACHGLTSPLIRCAIDKMEEDEFYPESLKDEEEEQVAAEVEAYMRFASRRKLCILHNIYNEGGELWLYNRGQVRNSCIHIPLAPNRMIIFRHDLMDYSYQVAPSSRSITLQAWILDEPSTIGIKNIQLTLATPEQRGLAVTNPGPVAQTNPHASILAIGNRMAGEAWSPDHWWNVFVAGTDCDVQWPKWRWDTEPYYEENTDPIATGKSYTCHMGALSMDQMASFDNEFFDVRQREASMMLPGQRLVCEVGYATLYKAGLNRDSLKGRRIGTWLGDVGPDWHSFTEIWPAYLDNPSPNEMATSMSCICTAGRLNHVFDMKGPVSSYDTACSSSLIALNSAHIAMFRGYRIGELGGLEMNPNARRGEDCTEALVGGVNTLLGPGSFISNCMAGMLTRKGRCFTFTDSADGYQRSDACGFLFARLFNGDKSELDSRLCALAGTGANADGKSASLTAPSGPAQQKLIRKSIAFSGIDPSMVAYAECHGTGTALGDPIEIGAMAAVLCQNREFPLLVGSHKSNTGHSEAGAGISGLTKCIMFVGMQAVPPNVHFNVLNANISHEGFPMHFASEAIDTGFSDSFCGVCSFGFGGSNARADISGSAYRGPRESMKIELPRVNQPRVVPFGQPLYLCGSWSKWSRCGPLERSKDGVYRGEVTLGNSGQEEFQISLSPEPGGKLGCFHPLISEAGAEAQVVGPDTQGQGMHFMIDGLLDGTGPGARYEVTFLWTEDCRQLSWRPLE